MVYNLWSCIEIKNVDSSRSPCLKIVDGKRFKRCNFLVLRPVLLKIAYFSSANREFFNGVRLVELCQRKVVNPSRAASCRLVERKIPKFSCKNFPKLWFVYLTAYPAETAYLSFRDQELSNDVQLVQMQPRKVVIHTFFGLSEPRLIRWPSCRNYQKS